MKGGNNEPGKYHYFLFPNNRSTEIGAQYLTTYGK